MGCCKFVKKGLVTAALGAGVLALLFGTAAPSYVRTAFHRFRDNTKHNIPVQFEIERARQEVAHLEPAIKENIEELARAEEDVKDLNSEIADMQKRHDKDGKEIAALRDSLRNGDLRLAGGASYTADDVKRALAHKFDHYMQVKKIIAEKERTLQAKERSVGSAREMLNTIKIERAALLAKIDEIEAKNKAIEAASAQNKFHFDETPLAEVKKTISELEKRVNVKARTADLEGRFADEETPVVVPQSDDVLKEIDAELGTGSTAPAKTV
jgi:septal ring factor EnvC (AmiA/AmiB activator)